MINHPIISDQPVSLCDALDRVLDTGVVALGELKISVADVDLLYVGLQLVVTSIEAGRDFSPQFVDHPPRDPGTPRFPPARPPDVLPATLSIPAATPSAAGARSGPRRTSAPSAGPAGPSVDKNGLGRLVLTLVKLLHQLLKLQALRRMESGSLTEPELDQLGVTLLRQAQEIERMAKEFGLKPEELNLDLGPLGKLM